MTQLADELYSTVRANTSARSSSSPTRPRSTPTIPTYWRPPHIYFSVRDATAKLSRPISASWTSIRIPITHIIRSGCACCIRAGPMKQSRCSRRRSDAIPKWVELRTIRKARLCAANAPQRRRVNSLDATGLGRYPTAIRNARQLNLRSPQPMHGLGILTRHIARSPRQTAFGPTTPYETTGRKTPQAACTWNRWNSFRPRFALPGIATIQRNMRISACRRMATCITFMPDSPTTVPGPRRFTPPSLKNYSMS